MSMSIDYSLSPLTPSTLQLYLLDETLVNTTIRFQVGYIDADYVLTDVTSTTVIVATSPDGVIFNGNTFTVNSSKIESVNFTATYITVASVTVTQYFYFTVHMPINILRNIDIVNAFEQYMPPSVYSTAVDSYTKIEDSASSTVLTELYKYQVEKTATSTFPFFEETQLTTTPVYKNYQEITNELYPSSGDPRWEVPTMGTHSLFRQENTDYGGLLEHIYQINTNNSNNPYWLAFNISKYIYLRLGLQFYVFVTDNRFYPHQSFIVGLNSMGYRMINGGIFSEHNEVNVYVFVGNNDDNNILVQNSSASGILGFYENLVLEDSSTGVNLPSGFAEELTLFCRKIINPTYFVNVYFNFLTDYFAMYDIDETYLGDKRQNDVACIAYDKDVLSEALGKTSSKSYGNITEFSATFTEVEELLTFKSAGIEEDAAFQYSGVSELFKTATFDPGGGKFQVTIDTVPITISPENNALVANYNSSNNESTYFRVENGKQYMYVRQYVDTSVDVYFLYLQEQYSFDSYSYIRFESSSILREAYVENNSTLKNLISSL